MIRPASHRVANLTRAHRIYGAAMTPRLGTWGGTGCQRRLGDGRGYINYHDYPQYLSGGLHNPQWAVWHNGAGEWGHIRQFSPSLAGRE